MRDEQLVVKLQYTYIPDVVYSITSNVPVFFKYRKVDGSAMQTARPMLGSVLEKRSAGVRRTSSDWSSGGTSQHLIF